MKKTIFALLASFFFLTGSIFAQSLSLDDICKVLSAHKVTEGNFVQKKYSPKDGRNMVSSGTFVFSTEGIILNTLRPISSKTGITPKAIINETSNGQRRIMDNSENATFSSISNMVVAILNGDKTELENNFVCDISGTAQSWKVILTPKDSTIASTISSIELNGNSSTITSLVMNASGNTTTTTLSNHSFKNGLSDENKKFLFAQ